MTCGVPVPVEDLEAPTRPELVAPKSQLTSLNLSWPRESLFTDAPSVEQSIVGRLNDVGTIHSQASDGHNAEAATRSGHNTSQPCDDYPSRPLYPNSNNSTNMFRILRLSKGQGNQPLHGFLIPASLDSQPTYHAVSYTWTDGDEPSKSADRQLHRLRPIFIGHKWKRFWISKNCEAMLQRFRKPSDHIALWVDAICINQDDPDERVHQVATMREIYTKATNVLVYLGSGSRDTGWALWALNPANTDLLQHVFASRDEYLSTLRKGLLELHYFSRVWIVQEVALARQVIFHYGHGSTETIDKVTLQRNTSLLKQAATLVSKFSTQALPLWIQNLTAEDGNSRREVTSSEFIYTTLGEWIFRGMGSGASDDRDKIFAFLGMIPTAAAQGLVADYRLTVQQVYTGVAAHILFEEDRRKSVNGNIRDVLEQANCGVKIWSMDDLALPSWVPDFRRTPRRPLKAPHHYCTILPSGSGKLSDSVKVLKQTGALAMQGYILWNAIMEGYVPLGLDSVVSLDVSAYRVPEFRLFLNRRHLGYRILFKSQFNTDQDIALLPSLPIPVDFGLHLRRTRSGAYTLRGLCMIQINEKYAEANLKERRIMGSIGADEFEFFWAMSQLSSLNLSCELWYKRWNDYREEHHSLAHLLSGLGYGHDVLAMTILESWDALWNSVDWFSIEKHVAGLLERFNARHDQASSVESNKTWDNIQDEVYSEAGVYEAEVKILHVCGGSKIYYECLEFLRDGTSDVFQRHLSKTIHNSRFIPELKTYYSRGQEDALKRCVEIIKEKSPGSATEFATLSGLSSPDTLQFPAEDPAHGIASGLFHKSDLESLPASHDCNSSGMSEHVTPSPKVSEKVRNSYVLHEHTGRVFKLLDDLGRTAYSRLHRKPEPCLYTTKRTEVIIV